MYARLGNTTPQTLCADVGQQAHRLIFADLSTKSEINLYDMVNRFQGKVSHTEPSGPAIDSTRPTLFICCIPIQSLSFGSRQEDITSFEVVSACRDPQLQVGKIYLNLIQKIWNLYM